MKSTFLIALLALVTIAGKAEAATLDITLGPSITYSYNSSQILPSSNVVIDNHTPGLHLIDNSQIIPAGDSLTDHWISPTGITGPDYLAVLGKTPNLKHEDKGSASFTLAHGDDHLGFTWGTIDAYNTLIIEAGGKKYKISGADILDALTGATAGVTQVDVEINDPMGNIHKAIFTSTGNTFELGNLLEADTPAATPLPATWLLFGTGLLALFWMARRRLPAQA